LIIATVRVGKLESCGPGVEPPLGSSSKGALGDKGEDVDINVNPAGFENYCTAQNNKGKAKRR